MTTLQAMAQIERSERGQKTGKLLLDFLKSNPVNGLDGNNCNAVVTLATDYLIGTGDDACHVRDELEALIERHAWVKE